MVRRPSPVRHRSWFTALTREHRRPDRIRNHPQAWRLAVATVCFGAFVGQLDASIVTLTYGGLRDEYRASLAAVEWVSLAYLLTLVALLLPAGRLGDAHGRKLFYLYGLVVFAIGSAACSLAPSLGTLLVFRLVQATGAAMMQANSVALVATAVPRDRLRLALGVQAAAQGLGLALGPLIGGVIVSVLGWRWVFALNVPVALLTLTAGRYLLPRTRHRNPATGFDGPGLALLATATTGTLLALSAVSGLPVPSWSAAVLLVAAGTAGWAFTQRQRSAAAPLLDVTLLRNRAVSRGLGGALCGYTVLFGPLVLVPLVLTEEGFTALEAGLVLTALPAGFVLAATNGDRLMPRGWGDPARTLLGSTLCAVCLAVLLAVPPAAARFLPVLAVLGLGLGIFLPANNTLVMAAVPTHSSGTAGSLVNMARGLGTALGVALVTFALHLPGAGSGTGGFQAAVLMLLAVAGFMLLTAWLGRRPRPAATAHPRSPGRPAASSSMLAEDRTGTARPHYSVSMSAQPGPAFPVPAPATDAPDGPHSSHGPDARDLTKAVTRLRRALRTSIRTDYPWETLPMAQVELLQVLAEHSPARVGDLAARQHLATSTVSGLVGQMIDNGLVTRATDPHDRRVSAVTLTGLGHAQLAAWTRAHEHRLASALEALDDGDRGALRAALPALLRLVEHLDGTRDTTR